MCTHTHPVDSFLAASSLLSIDDSRSGAWSEKLEAADMSDETLEFCKKLKSQSVFCLVFPLFLTKGLLVFSEETFVLLLHLAFTSPRVFFLASSGACSFVAYFGWYRKKRCIGMHLILRLGKKYSQIITTHKSVLFMRPTSFTIDFCKV